MFSDNFCHKDVAQCTTEDTTHRVNNSRNFLFREPNSKKLQKFVYYCGKKTVNGRGETAKRNYEMASTRKKKTR